MTNILYSKKKGQATVEIKNDVFEKLLVVFHANTLTPVVDTLHFGIKSGHFMVYTKKHNKKGYWLIKDAGYVNYYRKDQHEIEQTSYNTLGKQKLLSKGYFNLKETKNKVILSSFSFLPLHKRYLILDTEKNTIMVSDYFMWKANLYFNFFDGLDTESNWWTNAKLIRLDT
tara:strand:+ start:725 stop:1237 length:513 start_codon:yes stop_codon:yes gene_type:complete